MFISANSASRYEDSDESDRSADGPDSDGDLADITDETDVEQSLTKCGGVVKRIIQAGCGCASALIVHPNPLHNTVAYAYRRALSHAVECRCLAYRTHKPHNAPLLLLFCAPAHAHTHSDTLGPSFPPSASPRKTT